MRPQLALAVRKQAAGAVFAALRAMPAHRHFVQPELGWHQVCRRLYAQQ
jgi:hypothetical protein